MGFKLGDVAPDFSATTTEGKLNFHDYIGSGWVVFFAHPKDFTPVCTTELGYMARMQHEFKTRNTKLIGISIDSLENHIDWKDDIAEVMGAEVYYPLIADPDLSIAKLYDLIHPNAEGNAASRSAADNATARTILVIGPDKRIKFIAVYPMTTGRHFDEILRVIDSLQITANFGLATPAHWQADDDVIIPVSINHEEAKQRFPQGFKTLKPYLRMVRSPTH